MATATAPTRAPRAVPAPEVEDRPDLRVVEPVEDRRARRSFGGLVGTVSVVLLFLCIFGLVVFQVLLLQTQSHLDDIDAARATEEQRAAALDLETANLESPERIVAAAHGLGMISPDEPLYLEPGADDDARAAYDPATEPVGTIQAPEPTPEPTDPAGADLPSTATTTPSSPVDLAPGPPYTAENNWGAGGPPTTPPVYNAENNWGAGPNPAAATGGP